jgi:hypothetical protein
MEILPVRIQRSRKEKQVSPNGLPIIYVGRPSKWGNPFKVGTNIFGYKLGELMPFRNWASGIIDTNEKAVLAFRYGLEKMSPQKEIDDIKKELAGKNLSCWCKIGEACHADVLIEISNS